jgi:DNA helicase II / ATP-dependent DNA helicase PcrA
MISSDSTLPVDRHLHITAGPGAGKTYWLVGHIKNVLSTAGMLHATARVAVISYTNVAADKLRRDLGDLAARADVSTIHSFLYRHIVRPYAHLVLGDDQQPLINTALLDGHDEHHPNYQHIRTWLTEHGLQALMTFKKTEGALLRKHLATIRWVQAEHPNDWALRLRKDYGLTGKTKSALTPVALLEYKRPYWREGVIDHEDVLYFAYRILHDHPLLRECLRARFPVIFIDEFQDTVPAQTAIVKWLATRGSTVVVIGDAEQSIFEFAGASPTQFSTFTLAGMEYHEIPQNRRSTHAIIRLLNHLRGDGLNQECQRNVAGEPVSLFVGTPVAVTRHVRTIAGTTSVLTLARNQTTVDAVLADIEDETDDIWESFPEYEGRRAIFLKHACTALTLARAGRLDAAMKTMLRGVRHDNGDLKEPFKSKQRFSTLHRRAIAVTILEYLIQASATVEDKTIKAAYDAISERLATTINGLTLTKITTGAFADFSATVTMKRLLNSTKLANSDEVRDVRTIHKAKGTEASHVLVCLHGNKPEYTEQRLNHILSPAATSDEEQRITYVALSRVRDRLFLGTPTLTTVQEQRATQLGIIVTRLTTG